MSQRLLETDFPSTNPQVKRSLSREYNRQPANLHLRPLSTSGSMPKNLMASSASATASEWQYEPTFRPGSMSRVQTSFAGGNPATHGVASAAKPPPLPPTQQHRGGHGGQGHGGHVANNSGVVIGRTGSLRKAFTTSDEEDEAVADDERRPLQQQPQQPQRPQHPQSQQQKQTKHNNNSQSSTSDYHSDENPNLLPVEHRELPNFRLHQLNR